MHGIFSGNTQKGLEIVHRISKLLEVRNKMVIFLYPEENQEERNIELAKSTEKHK